MHLSISTAQTQRPFASFSSIMQSSTGHAAWQIEQAKAPKQVSGSMTAILRGNRLRGVFWSFVHMEGDYIPAAAEALTPALSQGEREQPERSF